MEITDEAALAPFREEAVILAFLANPTGPEAAALPAHELPIVYSNLAEACVHRVAALEAAPSAWGEAEACAARVVDIAVAALLNGNLEADAPSDNLALTHLVIALAAAEHADKRATLADPRYDLLVRLADGLAKRVATAPDGMLSAYARGSTPWPPDATSVIYALWLADQVAPSEQFDGRHAAPMRAYLGWASGRGRSLDWDLPVSEPGDAFGSAKLPRGTALAWTARYQAAWDKPGASDLWGRFKRSFWIDPGFREWPPGVERKGDATSGVLDDGVTSRATALALGAAHLLGDTASFEKLAALSLPSDLLSRAQRASAVGLVPWFSARR
ncbi:MAG: hypothetical protein FJ102_24930 [Deltaproteobacteria bacterium]|nr:hypothetical protein [Deltaproteobacteria bacterium]